MRSVRRDVVIDAPLDAVWRALTEPDGLAAWFDATVSIDPRPGGRIEFAWDAGGARAAVIETIEPPRSLAFRWLPFARGADGSTHQLPSARVEITVEPDGDGARVLVEETVLTGPSRIGVLSG